MATLNGEAKAFDERVELISCMKPDALRIRMEGKKTSFGSVIDNDAPTVFHVQKQEFFDLSDIVYIGFF